jgi:hypothetical protein
MNDLSIDHSSIESLVDPFLALVTQQELTVRTPIGMIEPWIVDTNSILKTESTIKTCGGISPPREKESSFGQAW